MKTKNNKNFLIIGGIVVAIVIALFLGLSKLFHVSTVNPVVNQIVTEASLEQAIPSSDVEGKDLSDVPRPSGFVRADYREDIDPETGEPNYIAIIYRTWGNKFDEAVSLYKQQMPSYGWRKIEEETQHAGINVGIPGVNVEVKKQNYVGYSRENEDNSYEVYITTTLLNVNGKDATEVEIEYNIYPKSTEGEETSYKPLGTQPLISEVEQYPNSIYYSKNQITVGGTTIVEDDYYVNSTIEDVYNFYKDNAPEGYVIQFSQITEDSASITYSSTSGTIISITIDPESEIGGVLIKISKTEV